VYCVCVMVGARDAAYDQFLEDLQKGGSGECRYGLFDFEYTHQCQGTSEVFHIFLFEMGFIGMWVKMRVVRVNNN